MKFVDLKNLIEGEFLQEGEPENLDEIVAHMATIAVSYGLYRKEMMEAYANGRDLTPEDVTAFYHHVLAYYARFDETPEPTRTLLQQQSTEVSARLKTLLDLTDEQLTPQDQEAHRSDQ